MSRMKKSDVEKSQTKQGPTLGDIDRASVQGVKWSDFERELETRVEREGRVSYQRCGGGRRVVRKKLGGD